jgi:NADPH2:quinone reductase
MKAIQVRQFGGPEVLRLEDVPDPKPGAGEVLVRIRAAGVNPVDAYIRSGTYGRTPALPYIPGSDAAGDIESVGADVKGWAPGDRVYIYGTAAGIAVGGRSGTYAERAVCKTTQVHRLTPRTSYAQGAAIGVPYATAYRALFHRAGARPGDTILVHGATGGVGLAAVQIAHAHGMTVIGTGGSDRGLQAVRQNGADVVANHRASNYLEEIMSATGGRGVDVVLEMAAHVNLGKDLPLLATRGRVVTIGSRGPIEINPRDLMGRDGTILGMTLFNVSDADSASIHAALVAGLANGTLAPVIGRELPLADAAKAHEAVMESGALGKIVLVP